MMDGFRSLLVGGGFGLALSSIGFTSWDEVHAMFTFADMRLTLTFAFAVVLIAAGFRLLGRFRPLTSPDRPVHRGTVPGAVLFGVGWALSGACPSIAFVQLGQGQLGALATIAGIFAGNLLFASANRRLFQLPSEGCAID
jgi:uncharacterized protein